MSKMFKIRKRLNIDFKNSIIKVLNTLTQLRNDEIENDRKRKYEQIRLVKKSLYNV